MNNPETYCPKNTLDWRKWLQKNHKEKDSIWLVFNKKNTPNFNLTWSDAVDQALCFGWIDSTKKSINNSCYKQYFCKRKAKSNWSKVNKSKVKTLIDQDLMEEAGYQSLALAKENGSWTILDKVEALEIPEDLKIAFSRFKSAEDFFDKLSNSAKKGLLYWVASAKRIETRQKRILDIAQNASQGLKPKQFR